MKLRSFALLAGLVVATSFSSIACSSTVVDSDDDQGALAMDEPAASGYGVDLAAVNTKWPNEAFKVEKADDLFSVLIQLEGGKSFRANTHLFTKSVNIIPYANPDVEGQVAASEGGRGDAIIGQYIQPGEVGMMIKHHRPEHRTLPLSSGGPDMKENFKLQDTHIGLIVGVERNGKAGAISINNPKGYEGGAFGQDHYPMVFVKPTFPAGVDAAAQKLYNDNIRAMAVLFNTVSVFPGDYNGGDPLAARNPAEIKRHVAMMVKAIGGDTAAQAWFGKPENKIYCAELAFVSFSAGVLVPLTKSHVVGLEGDGLTITDADWSAFERAVGSGWPFATAPIPSADSSPNGRLADVARYKPNFDALAALKPISEVVAAPKRLDGLPGAGLAFEPMTMADIVYHFFRTHVPRDPALQGISAGAPGNISLAELGEAKVAGIQADLLKKMEEGLFESMKIPATGQPGGEQRARSLSDEDLANLPSRLASGQRVAFTVKDTLDGIVSVVGKPYGSYEGFQRALQPWLMVARKVTSPRAGQTGEGLFSPPSLMHVLAQRDERGNPVHTGGYLGLQYLGHGLHFTMTKKVGGGAAPSAPAAPSGGSSSGGSSSNDRKQAPSGPSANPFGNP